MSERSTTSSAEPIPVAVVGCGRMGRYHAKAYSEMPRVKLVGVFDASPHVAQMTAEQYGCEPFGDLESLADRVKAVTIAVPTKFHLGVAEPLLKRGVACLIEKPLAPNVAEARRIVELAREHGAVVQVGHIERFNPALRAAQRFDLRPGFIEVSRVSPMTFRSIDVGVVLDMMIHDLDIVLRLANSPVADVQAVGVSVIGDVEDICNARITFENGCVANVTASRLAMKTERKMRLFSTEGYVSIDYQKRDGIVVRRAGNLASMRQAVAKIKSGEITDLSQLNYGELVQIEHLEIDGTDPLRAELESFINAVTTGTPPEVSAEDGLAAVELATRIVGVMKTQAL
jgi:predicted dehydrogenase